MNTQIFGYTPPSPADGSLVRYCAVHKTDEGNIIIQVRNSAGVINEITVPHPEAAHLGLALIVHTYDETRTR